MGRRWYNRHWELWRYVDHLILVQRNSTDVGAEYTVPGDFYRWRWSTGVANEGIYCGDGWNQT